MTTYLAFLRAINVAGHAIVRMTDLRDAFAAADCKKVRTFIQSGNVVFESEKAAAAVFESVRDSLRDLIGGEPEVFFRTMRDVERLVERAPFKRFEAEPKIKLYVAFLSRKPRLHPTLPLRLPKEALEAIAMGDREVFIVSRRKANGFYGFPNNFIEKELGVAATSRNWTTVTKIATFARSNPSR